MKHPNPNRKDATHERIVEAASRAIRRSGYGGTSVPDIMRDAGLTHGGFYAHFDSREAMLAEAADRAGADSVAKLARVASTAPPHRALQNMLKLYLSKEHIAEIVCPVAALGSEMPRQAPEVRRASASRTRSWASSTVRRAATSRIKEMIDLVARQSPDWGQPGAHERALVTASTMIGALLLARAVDDQRLSNAVRTAVLKHLAATDD